MLYHYRFFLYFCTMIIDILLLLVGTAMILWGADKLTDGAASLAHRLKVSDTVIGLTVVAMGTSLPEFSVSLFSSIQGSGGMSAGNIVGSNMFNILFIVGAVAFIHPLQVTKATVWKDIPLTILASVVLLLLCKDVLCGSTTQDVLTRADGVVMIMFFLIFLSYTFSIAKHKMPDNNMVKEMSLAMILLWLLVGFICLIGGGELLVESGTSIARQLGVSETVIGLTILAGGTSLPEFVASLIAARKGMSGMAIGNVVGSCVFNIFFVLGICSLVCPMDVSDIHPIQLYALIASGILVWLFSVSRTLIEKWEGLVMCLCYIAFIVYLILS